MDFTDMYKSTEFSIDHNGSVVFFTCEDISSEAKQALALPFGVISARSSQKTEEQNDAAEIQLEEDLKQAGYLYEKSVKRYGMTIERCFVVRFVSKEEILKLGEKYNQISVFYNDGAALTFYDCAPPYLELYRESIDKDIVFF